MSIRQRNIPRLESEAFNDSEVLRKSRSTPRISKLIILFISISSGLVLWLLNRSESPLPSRKLKSFQYETYQHLNHSEPIELQPGTKIMHVAKEFGPAIMGGLGVMLTALSIAQSNSNLLNISIILPHYSYLRNSSKFSSNHFINLPISINQKGKVKQIMVEIYKMEWKQSSTTTDSSSTSSTIPIYLIGPGNQSPFHVAFDIESPQEIYSAKKPLPQEWKDLWFSKSTAILINYLNLIGEKVDVVHLHGATNAMVPYFLHDFEDAPALVYTLHDSLDEVEYTNLVENVKIFIDPITTLVKHPRAIEYSNSEFINLDPTSSLYTLEPWIHHERYKSLPFFRTDNRQLFTSALGIDLCDQVTFVSKTIAKDLVEGEFRFSLEGLIMPSLLHRARQGDFIGVTNGLDFTGEEKNSFMNLQLSKLKLNFGMESSHTSIKLAAKRHLIHTLPSMFNSDDIDKPFLLFIGRFQYNKGCEFFESILQLFVRNNLGRLIVMGTPNNYPLQKLKHLEKLYPNHFTLIEDWSTQLQLGPIIRMASDYSFVPSFSEAFGLVAAEGLFFGSSIISSGVGGLSEFLVNYPLENPLQSKIANSFLFQLFPNRLGTSDLTLSAEKSRPNAIELEPGIQSCLKSVERAILVWNQLKKLPLKEQDELIRGKIRMATALEWNRENGPVQEYNHVYSRAIKIRNAIQR